MKKSQLFYIYNYATVKVRLFCLLYCSLNFMYLLRARHDHNKIAPCGMIKVFGFNWIGRVERGVFNRLGETRRYKMTAIMTHVGDLELTSKLQGSPKSASCIFSPTSYPIFCVHTLTWSRTQCFGDFGPTSFGR